jgi:hypothetical protein
MRHKLFKDAVKDNDDLDSLELLANDVIKMYNEGSIDEETEEELIGVIFDRRAELRGESK